MDTGSQVPVRFYTDTDVLGLEKFITSYSYYQKPIYHPIEFTAAVSYKFPSLLRRIIALVIDVIVMVLVFLSATILFELIGDVSQWFRAAVFIFMWYLYEPVLISYGCTVGQYFAKIRVRRQAHPEENIWLPYAFLRFSIKSLLGWITFITIPFSARKRAIHDLLSGSIMIVVK